MKLAAMFDLAPDEAALLEDACRDILDPLGIDARAFFARLNAGQALGAALGVTPDIAELLYAKAHRWFSAGRPERAEPIFNALCTAFPTDADYWIGLGVCLRLRDDPQGARLAFATAARLRPDWAVPAFHACELALRLGDLGEAVAMLRRFDALRDESTPEGMASEAHRIGQAIAFRRQGPAAGRAR